MQITINEQWIEKWMSNSYSIAICDYSLLNNSNSKQTAVKQDLKSLLNHHSSIKHNSQQFIPHQCSLKQSSNLVQECEGLFWELILFALVSTFGTTTWGVKFGPVGESLPRLPPCLTFVELDLDNFFSIQVTNVSYLQLVMCSYRTLDS